MLSSIGRCRVLSTNTSGLIGRANLDGSGANQTFVSGLHYPQGVAVDSTDGYIYWTTNLLGGTIARAKLNGTDVNETFIVGAIGAQGVAVDSSHGYIYWTSSISHGASTIGRADLDDTGVNRSFISTLLPPSGVAVDSADGYLYWTMPGLSTNTSGLIGRADLDGTGANQSLVRNLHYPQGIAVDSTDGYIYWTTNLLGGTIARAKLDDSDVNEEFIVAAGLDNPAGVAIDSSHGFIYWSNSIPHGASTIGRANLDGTGANPRFISTLLPAYGVAADDLFALGGPPPTPTVAQLVAAIETLGLSHGTERSLLAKLDAAQRSLDSVHIEAACGQLGAFIHEVHAQGGKKLDAAQAAKLIAKATEIRASLGCRAH